MHSIIDAAIDRGRAVLLVFALILIMGAGFYQNIPKEATPDVQRPFFYVSINHEGISPEDAEDLLVRPMEQKLTGIDGLKEIRAVAKEGHASLILEFIAGFNSDKALQDVREKVDEATPELPVDADEPIVQEINLSLFPVMNVILSGPYDQRTLLVLARDLQDKIESIPNVLEVNIGGDREEAVEVTLKPETLEGYGLNLADMLALLKGNNALVAAGTMDNVQGAYGIKLPGLVEEVRDFFNMPVKVTEGRVLTMQDIADIHRTFKDANGYARVNGERAVVLEISKRTGSNIIETLDAVKELLAEESTYWPEALHVTYAQDQSEQIVEMVNDLQNNVLLATLLVLVVMIYFMGSRTAVLVAVAIPGAFLLGVICLYLMGYTMNIVVLFSLIMAIGMLVDAAIVVCEDAARRLAEGENRALAYASAAKRMAWPVIASTITTLTVFFPLLFWPGEVGQFMKYLPITLIMTLGGSLLMALIFLPTIGTVVAMRQARKQPHLSIAVPDAPGEWTDRYAGVIGRLLCYPGRFVAAMCAVLVVMYVVYGSLGKGVEFFPEVEPENANVLVRARGNLSVAEKDGLIRQVEQRILDMRDEVRVFYARSGVLDMQDMPEDAIGVVQLEFADWQKRRTASEILAEMRKRTADISGIIIETRKQEGGPGGGKPIDVEFRSRYASLIAPEVERLVSAMRQVGGFVDIEDTRPVPKIEWRLVPDRELATRFGASIELAGQAVRLVTNGIKTGTYRPDDADDEIDIITRFPKEDRSIAQLQRLKVPTVQGFIPLTQFVSLQPAPETGTINRVDGVQVMQVKADLEEGVLADDKVQEIRAFYAENPPDPRVTLKFRGEDEEQKEAANFLSVAFLLALFGMFLVLVIQFNSLYQAGIVMSAVMFSTVGVLLGLLVTGQPFGIVMCGVGVIALAGIVVNNNIIFIDTYNQLRADGHDVQEALVLTGRQRLRPILLTAGTTVLGLLPMVIGMNINFMTRVVTFGAPSSQWWTQLSTSIAGGLAFATVLTLFFTPCLIMLGEKKKANEA